MDSMTSSVRCRVDGDGLKTAGLCRVFQALLKIRWIDSSRGRSRLECVELKHMTKVGTPSDGVGHVCGPGKQNRTLSEQRLISTARHSSFQRPLEDT